MSKHEFMFFKKYYRYFSFINLIGFNEFTLFSFWYRSSHKVQCQFCHGLLRKALLHRIKMMHVAFAIWSAELCHPSRSFLSLGLLKFDGIHRQSILKRWWPELLEDWDKEIFYNTLKPGVPNGIRTRIITLRGW